jgi:cyclin-dependent kinase 12/13
MGCVLGREVSSGIVSESKGVKKLRVESNRKIEDVSVTKTDTTSSVDEIKNEETQGEKVDGDKKPKGERRWSRPNSKPSNLPKQTRGEQVAAGWPPWLSAVCGEALNGWIPRRADTFEKIDKVSVIFRIQFYFPLRFHDCGNSETSNRMVVGLLVEFYLKCLPQMMQQACHNK